jgi:SAM-dependent methyltransferase
MKALAELGKGVLRSAKFYLQSAPLAFPRRVECNVCGWQGSRLISDGWHEHAQCPKCRSGVRHRLLVAALSSVPELSFEQLVRGKRVLHFAPERLIERRLRGLAGRYVTADYLNPRRDLQLDLSDMAAVRDGEFDLLLACDVLEHVPEDRRALREIERVLSPGGCAILTVPQQDHLAKTLEDPSVVSPAERERRFGQSDHLRIYGDDFPELLQAAGLHVTSIDEHCFSPNLAQRHVLFPPRLSTRPLATNFRKVFFAHKAAAKVLVPCAA